MKKAFVLICALCLMNESAGIAQEVVGWRTDGTGRYPSANPPTEWSHTKDEKKNIIWATEMPSWSNSTPVIVGDKIFVGSDKTDLVCVDRKTGAILWRKSNTYFDPMTPDELKKAKEIQKRAEEVRAAIRAVHNVLRPLETQLNRIRKLTKKIKDFEKKLSELKAEALAGKIEGLKKQADDVAKKLGAAPNDGKLKKQADQLAAQLKELQNEGAVKKKSENLSKQLDLAKEQLAEAGETNALKKRVDELKRIKNHLRNTELKALTTYDLPNTENTNGYSTCTPVSDGKNVYALFGNGMAACYDPDGNRKWLKFIEKPTQGYGHSASPVIVGDRFIIQIRGLVALDTNTGEQVWESREAPTRWGTPVVTKIGDDDVLITPNGDIVRASDGKLLAKKLSKLDYCAPIVHDGVAYFIQKGGKAIKLPDEVTDDMKFEALWTAAKIQGDRYYASPVCRDGLIYAINQRGHLSVIDTKTGELVYDKKLKLGATVYSSVTCAGDFLLVSGEKGKTMLLATGREYKEIATNQLEDFRSCPVLVGDRMYIRTKKHLYCIGK